VIELENQRDEAVNIKSLLEKTSSDLQNLLALKGKEVEAQGEDLE
jgi:hypothetical protein